MTASDPRVGEIQARLDAATPGPWRWRNTAKPMLMGARTRLVMAFSRMGMDSAQPEFRDGDGLMVKAGKANLNTFPDAEFIAAAPADVAYLLAELRDRDEKLAKVEGLARYLDTLADGYKHYAALIRAAVAAANGGGE